MEKKVLLDTDIGTDIDDAVCLAYLLAHPACDLKGITTVTGEAERRAMMASAICKVAGKEIPIYPGAEVPLLVPQKQTVAQQAEALQDWDHETEFPPGRAVAFLRETIRRNPGEITLLTVGPLTNIGLLFRVDPEIPSLLKELVMMVGVFTGTTGAREWNAMGDPHATAIVYQSEVRVHRSVGLDVTRQVRMPADRVRETFTSSLLEPVKDFAEVWFQRSDGITFHDPLAAATLFDDQVCEWRHGKVEVELVSDKTLGATYLEDTGDGAQEVALEVDRQRFFDNFFETVTG